jgi:hypothetical protein
VNSFLEVSGLVNHQDRVGVAEVVDDITAEVVTDQVGIPHTERDSRCCNASGVFAPRCPIWTSSSPGPDRTTIRASGRRRAGVVRAG